MKKQIEYGGPGPSAGGILSLKETIQSIMILFVANKGLVQECNKTLQRI
jgi:hypothetical protein